MARLRLALMQAAPATRSLLDVVQELDTEMHRASVQGVDLLVTPELYLSGYGSSDAVRTTAQSESSPVLAEIAQLCAKHSIGLVLGYPEQVEDKLFNSAVVYDRAGRQIHNYRKVALPNDFERDCFASGTGPEVFVFQGFRCSVVICYDVEFPELPRRAACLGAELLLVPTALRKEWRIVSDSVVPTRAYENGIYLAYCDYARPHESSKFSGTSTICAPNGTKLTSENPAPGLRVASIETGPAAKHGKDFDLLYGLKNSNSLTERFFQFT